MKTETKQEANVWFVCTMKKATLKPFVTSNAERL